MTSVHSSLPAGTIFTIHDEDDASYATAIDDSPTWDFVVPGESYLLIESIVIMPYPRKHWHEVVALSPDGTLVRLHFDNSSRYHIVPR